MKDRAQTIPLLPIRRPRWVLVIAAMLVFGFGQELTKIHLNDYIDTLEAHPELQPLSPAERAAYWAAAVPPRVVQYYEIHAPWPIFHTLDLATLWAIKWTLAVAILLVFFAMDAWFLRVTGAWSLRKGLVGVYVFVGAVMSLFAAFAPGEAGYAVARELLGFLQSPLPSFMLVFARWFFRRSGVS
jgi:hypothetical protein